MINRDEIEHANHQGFGHRLGAILREMRLGLDALNRFQYDRPWERLDHQRGRRVDAAGVVKH